MITLNLTKDEYKTLLDMTYIADWVINSNDVGEDKAHEPYVALRNKIFGLTKGEGLKDIAKYNEGKDTFFETQAFEEEMQEKFLQPYNDDEFWHTLVFELAKRDIEAEIDDEKFEALSMLDRMELLDKYEARYEDELLKNGLENFKMNAADKPAIEVDEPATETV